MGRHDDVIDVDGQNRKVEGEFLGGWNTSAVERQLQSLKNGMM